jgi:hypothetical protein
MSWECNKHRGKKTRTEFWLGSLRRSPLWRPRCRWKGNVIKVDLKEIVRRSANFIDLTEDRDWWRALVDTVMNCRVPWKVSHFSTDWATVSISTSTLMCGVGYREVVSENAQQLYSAWCLVTCSGVDCDKQKSMLRAFEINPRCRQSWCRVESCLQVTAESDRTVTSQRSCGCEYIDG